MYSALPTAYGRKLPVLSFVLTLLMMAMVSVGWGQSTLPSIFDLSTGNFTFSSYTGTSFPTYISVGTISSSVDGNFTSDLTTDAVYGTGAVQWKDEGINGISFLGGSNNKRGDFLFRANSTNRTNITLQWTCRTILNQTNNNYIELQWRNGSAGSWINVTGVTTTGAYPYLGGATTTTYSVNLPNGAANLSDLRIRWIYYEDNTGSNRDRIAIDDIIVSSSTNAISSLSVSPTTLSFNNQCVNSISAEQFFTITGSNLTNSNIVVAALNGYAYSTSSGGPYSSSLTLSQPGGTYSQKIYVQFTPTAAQAYNGNIVVSGGGASSSVNEAVTGTGINTASTVTTGSAASVSAASENVAGAITDNGCSAITVYGIEYSTTSGFSNGSGTQVTSSNLSSGNFSANLTGLSANTTYYYKAYAINSGGTSYGSQSSFTTSGLSVPTATAATSISNNSFTANWSAVPGATSYQLDVSTSSNFSTSTTGTLTENFNSFSGNTSYNGWTFSANIGYYTTSTSSGTSGPNSVKFISTTSGVGTATSPSVIGTATQLQFFLLNNSSSGSTMLVEGYDGTTWVTVATIPSSSISPSGTTFIYNATSSPKLSSNLSQFRFTYTKSSGNIALDDVVINYSNTTSDYVTGYQNKNVGNVTFGSVTGLSANTTYYYRVRATSANSTSANSNVVSVSTLNDPATADYRTKQSGNFSAASTWEYNSFGTTYVDATAPPTATNNITVQSTHTLTADQNITIGAGKTLTVSGTVTPLATIVISGAGTLTGSGNTGSVQVTAAGNTSGDFAAQYTIANKVLTNLEVDFAGNSGQYIDGISYGPLKFSNNTGVLLAGDVTVSNTLRRNAGALSLRSKKLTLVGNISNGNGNINAGTGEIVFGGTSAQTIPSDLFTGSVANLTINNNSGVVETSGTSLITGSLTLNAGTLSIGSSNLTITAALSRTNGNLDASAGTLIFTNGIAISIPGSTFTGPVQNLTINSSSSVALNSSLTINGALTLTSGSLDINDQTLTLIGSVVNSSGDLKGSNKSGLVLSGLTPVTLNFNNSFNVLRNLTISTGANVTLGSALRITSDTSLGSAGIVLVSGNLNTGSYKLTLKSSTSGTASVGTSTGTITGDITVERQIPDNGHREWRLLTAPVTGTTIKASWQENANPGGTNNPNPGFGTLITGPGQGSSATAAANGYDFWPAIANSSSSIRQYAGTPTSGSWVSIPSIKNLDISTYPAYLLFVRGDRSIYAAGTNTNATILQATGTLKQGTQSFTLYGSSVQGYTLVGNPYACAIDFDKILIRNATNLLPQFWRWDAQSGSYGGYTLVKKSGTTYYTVPSPFTGNGTATATQQYIESGQGFFVQPASGVTNNASFDIQEADKVINTTTTSPFRIKPPVEARLFINLNQYYSADSIVLSDGVLASFVNTADTTQNVAKPFNFNENLGISRGTSVLTVEAHKPVTSTDTIRLTLWNTTQRSYQLQLKADNWKTAVHAYLLDNYFKTSTPVNLKGNITTLNFAVDGTAASAAQDRFMVVFNTTAAAPLLARKLQTGDADVENGKSLVTVYPNPVGKDRIIHLQLANFATGNYHCSLYDNNGKPVLQTTIAVTGSSSAHIHIPQAAAQGLYYLKIADANGKIIRQVAVTVIY